MFSPWKPSPFAPLDYLIHQHRRPFAVLQSSNAIPVDCKEQKEKSDVTGKENRENATRKPELFHFFLQKKMEMQKAKKLSKQTLADDDLNINPVLMSDMYFQMKSQENPSSILFRKSKDKISIKMRSSIIDWLIFKTESFQFDTETLHLAVNYFDRYLSKEEADVTDLLLVGTSALLLACKHEEVQDKIPSIDDFVKHADGGFSKQELLKMEKKMLKALDFKLSFSTAYQFLHMFCNAYIVKKEEMFLSQYICDISLIHEEIHFCTKPSRIAAASIALSSYLLNDDSRLNDIEALSGYDQSDLKVTMRALFVKFDEMPVSLFENARAKYRFAKYKNVSWNSYPRALYI